jgi:hypothetical protein
MTLDEAYARAEGVLDTLDRLLKTGVISRDDYLRRLRDLHVWLDAEMAKFKPTENTDAKSN